MIYSLRQNLENGKALNIYVRFASLQRMHTLIIIIINLVSCGGSHMGNYETHTEDNNDIFQLINWNNNSFDVTCIY